MIFWNWSVTSFRSLFFLAMSLMADHVLALDNDAAAHRGIHDVLPKERPYYPNSDSGAPDEGDSHRILTSIEVLGSDLFSQEIQKYWGEYVGGVVSASEMIEFQFWFSDYAKAKGILAFAKTDLISLGIDRSRLQITVAVPKVRSIKLLVGDPETARKYEGILKHRLANELQQGQNIDVDGLDQRLEKSSFDLPVSLEVTIRSVGPDTVDLLVNVTEVKANLGRVLFAYGEVNNYGLSQYGRQQMLGQVKIDGPMPHASLKLNGLISNGLRYGRAEVEFANEPVAGRIGAFASISESQTQSSGESATKGKTVELGLKLSRLEETWSDLILHSDFEVGSRRTVSYLRFPHMEIDRIYDRKLRMSLDLNNERVRRDKLKLGVVVTFGRMTDAISSDKAGRYSKLELNASKRWILTRDGRVSVFAKANAQFSNKNLDSYNRMALGGINGVRAYSSADGVGDLGGVASVDIFYKISPEISASIFYDAGRIRPNKKPVVGVLNNIYSLQAVGLKIDGRLAGNWNYAAYIAKGLKTGGSRIAYRSGAVSEDSPFRVAMSVGYSF